MGLAVPLFVILNCEPIPLVEPREVGLPRGLVRIEDRQDHGSEKGRLRTAEVVGAVGIEDAPVMLELIKEILDHSFCQITATVAKQTADDEIAVPAIHLVELTARDHVGVLEIQQSVPLNLT